MSLETDIKQAKFKSEYQKLAVNIFDTHGWLVSKHAKILKKFGVTTAQFNILRILRGQHPNSAPISLLKERMLDKMSDSSILVERLKLKGLLTRKMCKDDRRRVNVLITRKGLGLLSKMDEHDKEAESFFSNISKLEAKELNSLLDKTRG